MSKLEQILAVLLVMCATGWALEYHHSETSGELAALRQAVNQASISAQAQYASLKAADFAKVSASVSDQIAGMIQRELGTLAQSIDTTKKDLTP